MTQMEELARMLRLPSIPTLALYAATILTELPVIFARMCITFAVAAIVLLTRGESVIAAERYVDFAVIPTLWSIFALITPLGGGWWWLNNMGGREPSERERTAYHDALQLLQAQSTLPLRLPGMWFVTDEPQPDAAVCGNTLMLSRGLLESEYLPAVLAHELGHLATSDGKLTAAINRLIINPFPKAREKQQRERSPVILADSKLLLTITLFGAGLWAVRWVVRFARGGFGLLLLVPFWGSYWREREYLADQYVATLGSGRGARGLPRGPRPHARPPRPVHLAHRAHPSTNRATHRPAPENRPASTHPDKPRVPDRADARSPERVMSSLTLVVGGTFAHSFAQPGRRRPPQPVLLVAPGAEPVKATPSGPPAAGPFGPTLTEPDPSAEQSLRSAGKTLPTFSHTDDGKELER